MVGTSIRNFWVLGLALYLLQNQAFGWGSDEPGPGSPASAERLSLRPAVNTVNIVV
jgi:hypothetical protein